MPRASARKRCSASAPSRPDSARCADKLAQGDKALVGNTGFRRCLKTVRGAHFAIDPPRVAADAAFDGLYVLRTNTKLTALQAMLRCRDLLRVELLIRQVKAVLATRPIYHSSDMAIRGHVFCSFLALVLAKELEDRLAAQGAAAEFDDIRRDLDRLQEIELEQDGKRLMLRTPTTGAAGKMFQAVGLALPPNIQQIATRDAAPVGVTPACRQPHFCGAKARREPAIILI
jgi:hypothetical protein